MSGGVDGLLSRVFLLRSSSYADSLRRLPDTPNA